MVSLIKDIDFSDIEEGFPALLGLILMPLTFSITVGIGAAFVAYVVVKVVRGKITRDPSAPVGAWPSRSSSTSSRTGSTRSFRSRRVAPTALTSAGSPAGAGLRRSRHPFLYHRPRCSNGPRCPSGPRVISARLPGARSVSIAAYVLAGSRLETPAEAGVAHFMEHITFKGTAALPVDPGDLARRSRASAARSTPRPIASRPSTGSASRAARRPGRWTSSAS